MGPSFWIPLSGKKGIYTNQKDKNESIFFALTSLLRGGEGDVMILSESLKLAYRFILTNHISPHTDRIRLWKTAEPALKKSQSDFARNIMETSNSC